VSYMMVSDIFVLAKEGGALYTLWETFKNSDQFFALKKIKSTFFTIYDRDKLGIETPLKVLKDLTDKERNSARVILVLTDEDTIHRKLYALRKKSSIPLLILRIWEALPEIKKSQNNKQIYCRHTGVNFFLTQQEYEINARRKGEVLKLDNPVCLQQEEKLGMQSELKMLRHTLEALCFPDRNDLFGRKKRNFGDLRLTVATHFYLDQENFETVTELLEEYSRYEPALLDRIQFVIVDDGSPLRYKIPDVDLNLTWIRISENIPWNQAGAKNLSMLYARSNNVVISDIDHLFPESTLSWLVKHNAPNKHFYKFYRKDPEGRTKKGHPNLFYLSRGRWFELFGMDEEFAGGYGAEDFRFVKNMRYRGTVQRYLPKKVYCQIRSVDREKSYHSLVRDLSFNTPIDTRKRLEADWFGSDFGHSRMNFDFDWDVILDRRRESYVRPPIEKAWRKRWLFRQIRSIFCPW